MANGIRLDISEFACIHLDLEKALNELCAVPYAGTGKNSQSKAMDAFLDRFDEARQIVRDYAHVLERDLDAIYEAAIQIEETDYLAARNFAAKRLRIAEEREFAPDPLFATEDSAQTGAEAIAEQKKEELESVLKGAHFGL